MRCFFLIAAVVAGFGYGAGFGAVRFLFPLAVSYIKRIVLVAVGVLIIGGIDCMADHLAVFPNGFSVDVNGDEFIPFWIRRTLLDGEPS